MKQFMDQICLPFKEQLSLKEFTEQTLFYDIETTGFTAKNSKIYLIGCAYRIQEQVITQQLFSENTSDEVDVLNEFLALCSKFQRMITFNGTGFDLPFIMERCKILGLFCPLDTMEHLDLYKQLSPLKKIFKLPNMKQKTLEQFLSLDRLDAYSGGELINVYQKYLSVPDKQKLELLQLHNKEDVLGMIELLPALAYPHFFQGDFTIQSMEVHSYQEYEGHSGSELLFTLHLMSPLPKRISCGREDIYLSGYGDTVRLNIKIYQGELKFFYSNYKDYYYLPDEDMAIHKSIAFYVDKNFRTKAKAASCYSRHSGCFLPQYQEILSPYFKLEYHDKISFIEMTEPFTTSKAIQKKYIMHLLEFLKKASCPH